MKGSAHFVIGLAAASCFPGVVAAGAAGRPLYFILAGIAGLLPDALDFKFTKSFYKSDILVVPDPLRPDAQQIADAVALAIARARATGRAVSLKLSAIRLGPDRWQRYTLALDVPARRVRVAYGPSVDAGGNPFPGPAPAVPVGEALCAAELELEYLATTAVDGCDEPVFRFEPRPDGRIGAVFIPWHRIWTHSLVTASLFGLAAAVAWDPLAGGVAFAAYAAHILADQAGYLGSNLFAPFTRQRRAGLKLMHAGWPLPNFAAVWVSAAVIFWNLAQEALDGAAGPDPWRYAVLAGAAPVAMFAWLTRRGRG